MRTDLEIQVLEHAVVVVHDAGVVAIHEYPGAWRRVNDPHGTVDVSWSQPKVPVRARHVTRIGVRWIAVRIVGPSEIEAQTPAGTVPVRPVAIRHHVGS